jgi:hypothetical protein
LLGIRDFILNKGVQHLALTSPTKQILEVSNVQSNQHETSKGEGQIKIEEKNGKKDKNTFNQFIK